MALSRNVRNLSIDEFLEYQKQNNVYALHIVIIKDFGDFYIENQHLYQVPKHKIISSVFESIYEDIKRHTIHQANIGGMKTKITVYDLFETPQEAYRALRLLNHKYGKYLKN